jgi:hypothetical protein
MKKKFFSIEKKISPSRFPSSHAAFGSHAAVDSISPTPLLAWASDESGNAYLPGKIPRYKKTIMGKI